MLEVESILWFCLFLRDMNGFHYYGGLLTISISNEIVDLHACVKEKTGSYRTHLSRTGISKRLRLRREIHSLDECWDFSYKVN